MRDFLAKLILKIWMFILKPTLRLHPQEFICIFNKFQKLFVDEERNFVTDK